LIQVKPDGNFDANNAPSMTTTRTLLQAPESAPAPESPELATAVGITLSVTLGAAVWAALLFFVFFR
jgi:hypothetical protein